MVVPGRSVLTNTYKKLIKWLSKHKCLGGIKFSNYPDGNGQSFSAVPFPTPEHVDAIENKKYLKKSKIMTPGRLAVANGSKIKEGRPPVDYDIKAIQRNLGNGFSGNLVAELYKIDRHKVTYFEALLKGPDHAEKALKKLKARYS